MTAGDWALNILLVAAVLRQVRGKKLTAVGLLWPVGLVIVAGIKYLHDVPTAGNDLELILASAAAGTVLGCACGALTRINAVAQGDLVAQATGAAAALWVLGMGSRMAFALYAENGGGASIGRFSLDHHITGAAAWTAGFVLMALTEVVGRTTLLAARARRFQHTALAD